MAVSALSSLTWEETVSEAKRWTQDGVSKFSVEKCDEGSKRISLCGPNCSFFVELPHDGDEEWIVWSDDESSASKLKSDYDYLTKPERTISEIMSRAALLLAKEQRLSDTENSASDCSEEKSNGDSSDYDPYADYSSNDEDAEQVEVKPKEYSADAFFTGSGSAAATQRLLKDLKGMNESAGKYGVSGQPRGDNLFLWDLELFDFEKGSALHSDLESYARNYKQKPVVQLEMKFPKDYPMAPPFVRVVRPRFQFLTGHVTVGGSVCLQLLTRSGWSPSNEIESILVQIRAEIMSDPRARLDPNPNREYSEYEAKDAFERMVQRYGWNK